MSNLLLSSFLNSVNTPTCFAIIALRSGPGSGTPTRFAITALKLATRVLYPPVINCPFGSPFGKLATYLITGTGIEAKRSKQNRNWNARIFPLQAATF